VSTELVHNPELNRYEAWVDGGLVGFAEYRLEGSRLTLTHTEVDPEHQGRGIGSRIAEFALTDVGARGLELIPRCPFIAAYVRRHPDLYLDMVPESLRAKVMD
jgi:uncharacterized protein